MSKKFSSKNSQRYVVVHRPHDDPSFYDTDASAHVLVPVSNPNKPGTEADLRKKEEAFVKPKDNKAHVGEAALYGINFDDSKYDYTQHLKPIGPVSYTHLDVYKRQQTNTLRHHHSISTRTNLRFPPLYLHKHPHSRTAKDR